MAGMDDSGGVVTEDASEMMFGAEHQQQRIRTGLRNTGTQKIVGRTVCVYCGAMFGVWPCGKTGQVAAAHKSHELAKAVRCPFVF